MTDYFDKKKDHILNCLRPAFLSGEGKLDELEGSIERLRIEVSFCMSVPGFPEDLAQLIHRDFAKYLPEPVPGVHQDLGGYGQQGDDGGMYAAAVLLVDRLHDLFHVLGERARAAPATSPLRHFSNDPRSAVFSLVDDQDERRLQILRQIQDPHAVELVRRYDAKVAKERAEASDG